MLFGERIIQWYKVHHRALPWRGTKNPYRIWLSEIILQQTRVEQGLEYYKRFVKKYPDVRKLAAAREGEVLKLWQGLGYYTRARNLHHTAKDIVKRFNGKFPKTWEEMRSLKGIGDYTAAAILSFAYNQKYPVVDGNVHRVLSRYLGIKTPLNTSKAKKEFYEAAMQLMAEVKEKDYATFNQAIMEFGALHCKPANPDCMNCPLQSACYAFAHKRVKQLPVKKKKSTPRDRYFHFMVLRYKNFIELEKRTGNDIWKNMYQFPLLETDKQLRMIHTQDLLSVFLSKTKVARVTAMKHQLSHQTIHATFYEIPMRKPTMGNSNIHKTISVKEIHRYPVPRLIEKYLEENP